MEKTNIQRWYRINVWVSVLGVIVFGISMILFKKSLLFLFPAMFGLGMGFKGFKNIYKNEGPPIDKKLKRPDYTKKKKKK